jgi:hypothetical protein
MPKTNKFSAFSVKILVLTVCFFAMNIPVFACEVCQRNQPEPLKGITHGIGPTGNLDYIIIGVASVIVIAAFVLSVKYLVWPKEKNSGHIKNIVLNEN